MIYYYWIDRQRLLILVFDRTNLAFDVKTVTEDQRSDLDDLAHRILGIIPGSPMSLVDRIQDFETPLWPVEPRAQAILDTADRLILSPHLGLHALPIQTR